jgi:hypothetical protein
MMAESERLSVFENADDVDLTPFEPKQDPKKPKPPREKVKAVSEAARFPSREAPAPVPEPLTRKPRYHKTGRTTQFNTRIMPATHAKVYEIADRQGWLVGETVERAIEALERELRAGEGASGS